MKQKTLAQPQRNFTLSAEQTFPSRGIFGLCAAGRQRLAWSLNLSVLRDVPRSAMEWKESVRLDFRYSRHTAPFHHFDFAASAASWIIDNRMEL